jgi:hypothetical protein
VKRVRDASGREVTEQYLEGLAETEASTFDEEWRREAERKLPTLGASSRRLAESSHRIQQQPTLALPDSGSSGRQSCRMLSLRPCSNLKIRCIVWWYGKLFRTSMAEQLLSLSMVLITIAVVNRGVGALACVVSHMEHEKQAIKICLGWFGIL